MALTRIQELEAASRRQRTILEDIQEALNDMNINTANTASRLNVLEAIAKRQREVHHIFYMYKNIRFLYQTKECTFHEYRICGEYPSIHSKCRIYLISQLL